MEVRSPSKSQSVREVGAPGQARAHKLYSFKDEHVVSLFKLLQKSNKFKLLEARRPKEAGKTNDPSYCLYHKMRGHPTKNCYIFKDVLQVLIKAEMLKFRPEQKKVTTYMTTISPLQFSQDLPQAPTRVVPIPRGELRMININSHTQKEKSLVLVPTPRGETMWVHPDIVESQQ